MSYERECELYALYGDPERDNADYELAASHDRFDGWGDPDTDPGDYPPEPEEIWHSVLRDEELAENHWDRHWADSVTAPDLVPF